MEWINLDRGLLDSFHRTKIGIRIWLYLYTLDRKAWTPEDAARDLGMAIGQVKQQARELAAMKYIEWQPSFYKHARKRKIPNNIKWEVWERDNFTCKCGARKFLSVDHIVPESRGGKTEMDNLQTLCKSCNSKKGIR